MASNRAYDQEINMLSLHLVQLSLCQHPHDPAGPGRVRLAHSPHCQRFARNHALDLRPRQSLRQFPARHELPVAHRSTALGPTIRRDSAPVQLRAASGLKIAPGASNVMLGLPLQVAQPPVSTPRLDAAEPTARQVKGEYHGEPNGIDSGQRHSPTREMAEEDAAWLGPEAPI